jgi:hypothetical protein
MADGLPLDPKVPGEPGEKSPQRPTADLTALLRKVQQGTGGSMVDEGAAKAGAAVARAPIAAVRPAAKSPAAAPPVPVRKIDVPTALAQRVRRFEQSKPVPLRSLLNDLEDLVTVPIRGNKQEIADLDDLMQTPISLQLENTTVAGMLEAVLAPAGLKYQVQPDAIQLHRLGAAPGQPASP